MQVTRRMLLGTVAPGAAFMLAGCAGGSFSVSQFAQDVQALAVAAQQMLSELPTTIPASTMSAITTILNTIKNLAATAGSVANQSQGASLIQEIEAEINSLAPILLPLLSLIPGIGPVVAILGMIVQALPAIELIVGILISSLSPTAQAAAASAPPLPLTAAPGFDVHQAYLNMLIQRAAAVRARKLRYR